MYTGVALHGIERCNMDKLRRRNQVANTSILFLTTCAFSGRIQRQMDFFGAE